MNCVSKNMLSLARWPAPIILLSVSQLGPSALLKSWVGEELCKAGLNINRALGATWVIDSRELL